MKAIRPCLSMFVLAAMLLVSEGIAVSLHWCCGTVESLAFFSTADNCCCESDEQSRCTLAQADYCCQTTTAYLLLPVGSPRTDVRTSLPPLWSVAATFWLPYRTTTLTDNTFYLLPSLIQARSSPSRLQRFRL